MSTRVSLVWMGLAIAPAALAAEPPWLTEARAREGEIMAPVTVSSEDGWFTAKVPAKPIEKVAGSEGGYEITLDVGAGNPVSCEVLRGGFDAAALLRSTATLTFDHLAEAQGKIEMREVDRSDAGAYGESPYLALDWLYLQKQDGKPLVGALKQFAALKDGHGIYCAHAELGYVRTFQRVVQALAETLVVKEPAAAPYYREVATLALAGRKVGVSSTTITRDADGDSRIEVVTSLLVPVTRDQLRAQDTVDVQWVRPDRTLINATHVAADNGEIASNLKLLPTDGGWTVEGEMKGKKLSQALAPEPAPSSYLQQAAMRRAMLAQEKPVGSRDTQWHWLSADPLRLTQASVEVLGAADGQFTARETAGPLTMDTVLDPATGMPTRGSIQIGPSALTIERVFLRGSF